MNGIIIFLIILIFAIAYLIRQIYEIKRRLVRLIQENAVIWQFIKEQENR
ncbi:MULTISPECIES: hypothetical protein [Clostridium]|jgi:4-hydroxybenzoate polyprenyltransferase|uniref:Uncharacterized protein n=2 Tax=Clostridium TaxID=1485 RepID=A0A1S8SAD8_CLOBE|nr:hypothetical protein [Clostridium beijerinckii]NRY59476.1 4-hydroxybenzoate polyprenyltransferase [Clostridium beijerinckii]OOM62369.1 hypothetical protein CLBCK_17990 [Clostridium beijerinckii]